MSYEVGDVLVTTIGLSIFACVAVAMATMTKVEDFQVNKHAEFMCRHEDSRREYDSCLQKERESFNLFLGRNTDE